MWGGFAYGKIRKLTFDKNIPAQAFLRQQGARGRGRAPANHCSIMDTRTVVSIVPAVMQAVQLRGAAVLDAAAFGMRVLCSAVWRASTVPLESGPAAMLLGVCVCTVAPIMLAVLHVALARSAWAELPWSRRVFVAR